MLPAGDALAGVKRCSILLLAAAITASAFALLRHNRADAAARYSTSSRATASSRVPTVTLNNGVSMPIVSLGIWQFSDVEVAATVPLAMSLGFNHIDASIFYGVPENDGPPNQPALGRALANVPRDSFFLTTKIDPSFEDSDSYAVIATPFTPANAYFRTLEQAAHNLGDLGLGFVDLMLVHWSSAECETMREIWRAMETVQELGWARAVGVSNYCPATLDCILPMAKVVPAVNQVKYHLGMDGAGDPGGIKSYCGARGITLQAYSPLGSGGKQHDSSLIDGELVSSIGHAHGVSGAQVSLRWVLQHDVPLSTKSTKASHLRAALEAAYAFELDEAEMASLDAHVGAVPESYSFTCDCKAAQCFKTPSPFW